MSKGNHDDPRPYSRHIEVIGLPGAGKTTLLERLRSQQSAAPLIVDRPPDPKRGDVLAARARLVARLCLTTRDVGWLVPWRQPGLRWLLDKHAFRRAAFDLGSEARPQVLADAGFLEPLVTRATYHGRLDPARERALLALVPRPASVIYVLCDTDVAYERFVQRERRLDRLPPGLSLDTLRRNFDAAGEVCGHLQAWAESEAIRTVRIDATGTPSDADVDRLVSEVLSSAR